MGFVVGVAGLMHESNSFSSDNTVLSDFGGMRGAAEGDSANLLEAWRASNTEVSGFLEGADSEKFDVFAGFIANATPKGPLTRETFETLIAKLIGSLQSAPRLDGIYLALHGAMVAEHHPQADEEIVRRVRNAFGPDMLIVVSHDFHGNPSPALVELCNAFVGYQQNPHLDTHLRGKRAASIMGRTLRGEIKPVQAIVKPSMVYNIVFQHTYAEPLLPITAASMALENENPKVLAATVMGGYQYGDVPYMGPSVIVCTDGDLTLANKEADRLGQMLWETREQTQLNLPAPDQAVKEAIHSKQHPVALFDTGDNVGGGSAADSTFLLDELIRQNAIGWVVTIFDPDAVKVAVSAGVGSDFSAHVGGKTDELHGHPLLISGKVRSLHSGDYVETEVRHGGGRYFSMGLTAVIEAEGGTWDSPNLLVLTTKRTVPFSIQQLVSLGIYPERQKILVAKGTVAPRAAYEPVSAKIILVDSPGATAVNPRRFTFRNVRPNLWGLH